VTGGPGFPTRVIYDLEKIDWSNFRAKGAPMALRPPPTPPSDTPPVASMTQRDWQNLHGVAELLYKARAATAEMKGSIGPRQNPDSQVLDAYHSLNNITSDLEYRATALTSIIVLHQKDPALGAALEKMDYTLLQQIHRRSAGGLL
jgi:hypothetical protein